ncbi:hypothetical protein DPMN_157613 [Dreissena polymorpha]|uniref:Uncharacterized protein n=1 Tax=Dreissena polymorpha TaxID=45954 RepID=A0A9D4EKU7_DREPO|nr:hypothetical protein DPMN_157613 [Dreissena polymorpha]
MITHEELCRRTKQQQLKEGVCDGYASPFASLHPIRQSNLSPEKSNERGSEGGLEIPGAATLDVDAKQRGKTSGQLERLTQERDALKNWLAAFVPDGITGEKEMS